MLSYPSSRRNSFSSLDQEQAIFGPIIRSIKQSANSFHQSFNQTIKRMMQTNNRVKSNHTNVVIAFFLVAFICVILLYAHLQYVDSKLHDIMVQTNTLTESIQPDNQAITPALIQSTNQTIVDQLVIENQPIEEELTNTKWLKSYFANPSLSSTSTPAPKVVTATRWWCTLPSVDQSSSQSDDQTDESKQVDETEKAAVAITGDLNRLLTFIDAALSYSDLVLIAINFERDQCESAAFLHTYYSQIPDVLHRIKIVPVMPWISITAALNSLLLVASHNRAQFILYQSVEAKASIAEVNELLSHMHESDTLVTGACLPGQECGEPSKEPEPQAITGVNNPWNTFAVWHVQSLKLTGFLSVSDSSDIEHVTDQGQEEGPTIANLQMIAKIARDKQSPVKHRSAAKMVLFREQLSWTSDSVGRDEHHQWKMSTKKERYQAHMNKLGLDHGAVTIVRQAERKTEDSHANDM